MEVMEAKAELRNYKRANKKRSIAGSPNTNESAFSNVQFLELVRTSANAKQERMMGCSSHCISHCNGHVVERA